MIICLIYNYINCQSCSMVKSYQEFLQILQILTFKFSHISQKVQWTAVFILTCLEVCISLYTVFKVLLFCCCCLVGFFPFGAHIFVNFAVKSNYFFRCLSSTKYLDKFLTYWDLKIVFLAIRISEMAKLRKHWKIMPVEVGTDVLLSLKYQCFDACHNCWNYHHWESWGFAGCLSFCFWICINIWEHWIIWRIYWWNHC